jgi:hypothetical protein
MPPSMPGLTSWFARGGILPPIGQFGEAARRTRTTVLVRRAANAYLLSR